MLGNIEFSGLETSLVNVMSGEIVLHIFIEQQKDRYIQYRRRKSGYYN